MSSNDRRARARRKAWGRGPMILRFDPLEGRQLLSTLTTDATATSAEVATTTAVPDADPAALAAGTTTAVVDVLMSTDDGTDAIAYSTGPVDDAVTTAVVDGETPTPVVVADPAPTTTETETTPTPTPVDPADHPDLVPVTFGAKNNLSWGERFPVQGTIRNEGNTAAPGGVKVDVYASTTPQLESDAVFVGSVTIDEPIAAGASTDFSGSLVAPPIAFTSSPNYFFTLKVDSDGVVAETDEVNNGGGGGSPNVSVQVVAEQHAELVATGFVVDPLLNSTLRWGRTVQVAATISNSALSVAAPATRARVVAYPKGTSPDGPSAVTVGELYAPALAGGASTTLHGTIYLPLTTPTPLVGQSAITFTVIPDADYLTRPAMEATTLRGEGLDSVTKTILPASATPTPTPAAVSKADLKVSKVQPASDTLVWGKTFDVRATVENAGKAEASSVRVRFMLIDANRPNAAPLALADAVIPPLKAGFQQEIIQTIDLAGALPNGLRPEQIAGRIVVIVDAENTVDESNEGNNRLMSSAVSLKLLTKATDATPTTTTPPSGTVTTPGAITPPTGGTPITPATPTPTTNTPTTTSKPMTPAQRRAARLAAMRTDGAHQAIRGNAAKRAAAARALQVRLRTAQNALKVFRDGAQRRFHNG